jgi:hypothetical protein
VNPWEILWIALGWLGVIAVLLIAAIIVLLLAIESYKAAAKAIRRQ